MQREAACLWQIVARAWRGSMVRMQGISAGANRQRMVAGFAFTRHSSLQSGAFAACRVSPSHSSARLLPACARRWPTRLCCAQRQGAMVARTNHDPRMSTACMPCSWRVLNCWLITIRKQATVPFMQKERPACVGAGLVLQKAHEQASDLAMAGRAARPG